MEIASKKDLPTVLILLNNEGYIQTVEDPPVVEKIIEATDPRTNITIVMFLKGEEVVAFSTKVSHSIFSDPELSEIEIDLHQKIIAA
jgi:hypothetical protein